MENYLDLLKAYRDYLRLKNFSEQTQKSYLRTIANFYDYVMVNGLGKIGDESKAQQYLLYRLDNKKSWSTLNGDYSSLRKFHKEILGVPWSLRKLPRPRKDKSLPSVLSQREVIALIENARLYKHQVFLSFVYGTGLRLSEALSVLLTDIDGDRKQIRINKGKGHKDRIVLIPECLLELLRRYYIRCRPVDYLFNGKRKGDPYSRRAAQWIIIQSRRRCGLKKTATIHTLRHCYATHHIENGTSLVYLQQQLGHKHLRTTAKYVHLCPEIAHYIHHPLASMEIRYR